jgi:glyoxylase-like metal-dependent hydrolase (beta-lactamase superfamily II)
MKVSVGSSTFTVFEMGRLSMKLKDLVRKDTELPEGVSFDTDMEIPIYNALLSIGNAVVVIDPCDFDALTKPEERPRGYASPRPIVSQLSSAGVRPEDVTHVVFTHFHTDHIIGSTVRRPDGPYVPAFPRARYFLGKADWDSPMVQEELKGGTQTANSLGVLHDSGVLKLVNETTEVAPGVTIVPIPGESPGHQGVRVSSDGKTLWCIGDLVHEPIDVEHPGIMADWNDPEANAKSRAFIFAEAAREDALVFAGHMSLGRIRKTARGYEWARSSSRGTDGHPS